MRLGEARTAEQDGTGTDDQAKEATPEPAAPPAITGLLDQLTGAMRTGLSGEQYQQVHARVRQQCLVADLELNLQFVQRLLHSSSDVVYRRFSLDLPDSPPAALVYVDGLADKKIIDQSILLPLMQKMTDRLHSHSTVDGDDQREGGSAPMGELLRTVHGRLLPHNELQQAHTFGDLEEGVMRGQTALLIEGQAIALLAATQGAKFRGVEEPKTEMLVRGPRDGFTESLGTNTALVRQRLPTAALKIELRKVGRLTRTRVAVTYVEGVVNPAVLQEVRKRLSRIEIDSVLESGYLEEFIEDAPWSPFPQIEHTERPDKTAGALLEGRVAIMTDNTPFVLLVPTTLPMFLSSTEDYYERFWYSTFIRWIRFFAVFIALLLPSIYVAITTYQTELIPTGLLFNLAAAREGVPFPSVVEALLMEFSLEALREAGIRMPRPVGQAVSIVGGLVIGQSAVQAGIASPAMVIVVALTAIASFVVPAYKTMNTIRMLRFGFMAVAATMGLPGIVWGILAIQVHLTSLRCFGVPYLAPISPLNVPALQDMLIRAPWWAMIRRPWMTSNRSRQRQPAGQMPRPPRPQPPGAKGGS